MSWPTGQVGVTQAAALGEADHPERTVGSVDAVYVRGALEHLMVGHPLPRPLAPPAAAPAITQLSNVHAARSSIHYGIWRQGMLAAAHALTAIILWTTPVVRDAGCCDIKRM